MKNAQMSYKQQAEMNDIKVYAMKKEGQNQCQ